MKKIYTIILLLFTINNYSCMDVTAKMSQDIKNSKLISWLLYNNQNYVPAPGNVRAEGVSETEIKLTWEYHSNNINGFTIERSKTGNADDFKEIGAIVASYNSYNDNDANNDLANSERLEANTFYHYRIKAYNEDSDSEYSKLVKVKTFTDVTWEKVYGGSIYEEIKSIKQTVDGGYIAAGVIQSGSTASYKIWILKLDKNGNISWDKIFDNCNLYFGNIIQQTQDGGYIIAAYKSVHNGDLWLIKLDGNGNIIWDKTHGGDNNEFIDSIQQTLDGGFIVAGTIANQVYWNIWILKLDKNGNKEWSKSYGDTNNAYAYSIQQTKEGGFIIAGNIRLHNDDIWILKLDKNGNKEWDKIYDINDFDMPYSIQQTKDGGFIVAGITYSYNNNIAHILILKLNENGNIMWNKIYNYNYHTFAFSIQQTTDNGFIVAGNILLNDAVFGNMLIFKLDENGKEKWSKYYESNSNEGAYSIQQTTDEGFIVAGYTQRNNNTDFLILKLNDIGEYKK